MGVIKINVPWFKFPIKCRDYQSEYLKNLNIYPVTKDIRIWKG